MKTREQRKRTQKRKRTFLFCTIALILIILISISALCKFRNEHFHNGTIINGIDCSWLTIEDANTEINTFLENQSISFYFTEETYSIPASFIDLKLSNTSELESILEKQNNGEKTKEYFLKNTITFDKTKLREDILKNIDSLKEENMRYPQNAYLLLDAFGFFEIIPEQLGNFINFEEAYNLACTDLSNGKTTIDFTEITLSEPEIISSDDNLNNQKEELNDILSTVVKIKLADETIVTLDHSVMKNWLVQNEEGNYDIKIDSNLSDFVSSLSKKVKQASSYIDFTGTGIGNVSVPYTMYLDSKKQFEELKIKLLSGGTYHCIPTYSNNLNLESYIELDLTRQNIWMYYNGECIVDTPCVTGDVSDGHSTPPGVFYLTYKETSRYLQGYNNDGTRYKSYVDYWMPFNGGIGFHDASWRNKFGGTIYKNNGSHGCVNLPFNAAKTMYEYIDSSMPIIVYSSEA